MWPSPVSELFIHSNILLFTLQMKFVLFKHRSVELSWSSPCLNTLSRHITDARLNPFKFTPCPRLFIPRRSVLKHYIGFCHTDLPCTSMVSSLQGAVCSTRIVSMKQRRKRTVLLLSRVLTVVADGDNHIFRSSSVGVKLISTYTLRFERANNSISVCIERHEWCKNACAAYDTGLYKFVFPFISIFCTRVS